MNLDELSWICSVLAGIFIGFRETLMIELNIVAFFMYLLIYKSIKLKYR